MEEVVEYAALGLLSVGVLLAAAPRILGELNLIEAESRRECVMALESALRSAAAEAEASGFGRAEAFLSCEVEVSGGGRSIVLSSGGFSRVLNVGVPITVESGILSGSVEIRAERGEGGSVRLWLGG